MKLNNVPLDAGLAVKTAPVAAKESHKHADRFVFCLEDITLNDRRLSTDFIHAGRITRLSDITYADRDMSEEALTRETLPTGDDDSYDVTLTKTAYASALEVYAAYGQRGLIILESLTGADNATVKALSKEFLTDIPENIITFRDELEAKPGLSGIGARLRDELVRCANVTINYRSDVINKAESEMAQRALPNGVGLDRITNGMKMYARSLGYVFDVEKLDMVNNAKQQPINIKLENAFTKEQVDLMIQSAVEAALAKDKAVAKK